MPIRSISFTVFPQSFQTIKHEVSMEKTNITWVDVKERRLIWHRAARRRWKTICWELGCDPSTAWRKWNIALAKIAARLNR